MLESEWEPWSAFGMLAGLLVVSAFFSGSETAMNSINRYRLAYWARNGHNWAIQASRLLQRPERLLGMILVGNNIANISAAALVTLIAAQMWGQAAVPIAGILLTLVILIFAEVVPKSLAANRPDQVVRLVVMPLRLFAGVLWPLVALVNQLASLLLKPFRLRPGGPSLALDQQELRVLLETAGELLPQAHLDATLRVLDLSELTVADAMVPHTAIVGLDLEDSIEEIRTQLQSSWYSRMPVYRRSIDEVIGFLSLRSLNQHLSKGGVIDKAVLENNLSSPVFVPETTSLYQQMENFRQQQYNTALVVDEYGNVRGLLTVWDLVSEILGLRQGGDRESHWQRSGDGILAEGRVQARDINRSMNWQLPDNEEIRTLNGLILEELEVIPQGNICLELGDYRIETRRIDDQVVRQMRIWKRD